MSIYLKKFETQAAYESAESVLILPNVSLITENNSVAYKPTAPTPSHDYVEIGGVKWATMNNGATGVTDYGQYFQWGDTQGYTAAQVGSGEGQKYFGWEDYKYWTSDTGSGSSGMTKYNTTDGKTVLDAEDDAVTAAWGGNWRTPTVEEYTALQEAANIEYTDNYQNSGVSGFICTDKTDSTKVLFLPYTNWASYGNIGELPYACGMYMINSIASYPSSKTKSNALYFYANAQTHEITYYYGWSERRSCGYPVRGVLDE